MTKRPNEKNERLKRRFLEYRKFARQLSEKTLDREIAALERFDVWNGRKDFARFHIEQAMGFRTHLEQSKTNTGKPLGKSTMRSVFGNLKGIYPLAFSARRVPQPDLSSDAEEQRRDVYRLMIK